MSNIKLIPVVDDSIKKIREDLGKIRYKIKSISPFLNGDIYIHIENPYIKSKTKI